MGKMNGWMTSKDGGGKRSRLGFTLIELLVVIAIIALIAAILFPVFAAAREKARQSACMQNMKQIGLASMQYIQDYDETPMNGQTGSTSQPRNWGLGWTGQLYPYVKTVAVFTCPDDPTPYYAGSISGEKFGAAWSYAMNADMGVNPTTQPGSNDYSYPISKYTAPDVTVMLCEVQGNAFGDTVTPTRDSRSPTTWGLAVYDDPTGNNSVTSCPFVPVAFNATFPLVLATGWMGNHIGTNFDGANDGCRYTGQYGVHNGGSTFLMCDGHAKWLPGSAVSPGYIAQSPTVGEGQYYILDASGASALDMNGSPNITFRATFSIL
jgi:prepilin-type N-terminal cleavage/methylation domain-containing protein/prepilin-type processing-associated H-X9-DG protein